MRPSLAIAVVALVATTGCTGGDGGADQQGEHSPTTAAAHGNLSTPTLEDIQQILDDARPAKATQGLLVDESYQRESGLETATMSYCEGQPNPVDRLRLARSQRWWANAAWPSPDDGGYTVGVEVVLYEPGGVDKTMAAFRAVPSVCTEAKHASQAKATYAPGDPPDGLPAGSAALRDEWTYPNGTTAPGLIVAIPTGDIIGFLYIRGHEPTVQERAGELARALADSLSVADAQLASVEGVR